MLFILILFVIALVIIMLKALFAPSSMEIKEECEPLVITEEPDYMKPQLTESYLTLKNYVGQNRSIEYLRGHIRKAKENETPLPHIVLWGNGGLGKSTLIKATAHEMGGRFFELIPANLKSTKELFGILFKKECPSCDYPNPFSSNRCLRCKEAINIFFTPVCQLQEYDVIFLEECHGLKDDIEEAMYSLMQDGYIMVRYNGVDQKISLPNITIAGATTQLGDLKKPFRDRFRLNIKLEPYTNEQIKIITKMYVENQKLQITENGLDLIAKISHGTPRIAKKYVIDGATISSKITSDAIRKIMSLLGVDEYGLDYTHIAGMKHILERMKAMKNGGAGSAAIASSLGIPKAVWEALYEPALIYQDMIFMGSRGRRLTDKAIDTYFSTEKHEIRE